MRSRSIVSLTLLLSSLVLLMAGTVAYQSNTRLVTTSATVVHIKDVQFGLERTLSVLRDAETGQRGFLLTERTNYLDPYQRALTDLDQQLARLRALLTEPANQRAFDELTALVKVKTEELARTIDLQRSGTRNEALAIVLADSGRFAMDEIRALIERLQTDADRQLAVELVAEEQARTATARSIATATALAIAILIVLMLVARRDATRIRTSEQRLATTLRSIGDAVIATDARGIVNVLNPIAEQLTGWKSTAAAGKHMDEVFRIINEDSRETVESPVAKVLREGRIVGLANHTLLIRRDGAETPIEDSAAPIVDLTGAMLGVVLVFRDATEARAAAQALRDADRRKDEFIAVLAHELRNPLAPIRQAAKIVRSSAASAAQIAWSHDIIERQVGHMARLLDDLLDVSRITRGTLEIRKTDAELESIVEAAIEMARPLIDARQHALHIELPTERLPLDADPLRLAQVIGNLLTNAAKYTNVGGEIRLVARREGDLAAVHIVDNGIGLSRESLTEIFQMFVQILPPSERDEGGLGIGLSLSKGLVELHDGTIEARSAGLGKGSEFIVRLPLSRESNVPAQPPAAPAAPKNAGLRIVVADDNRDAAMSLAALLELGGHRVETVHDGAAAWLALERSRPHVALLDIGMPSVNGYDVAKRVRATDWGAAVKLVAVTGWGQETDKDRALEAGFDEHWVKPIDPSAALAFCDALARSD